MTAQTAQCWNQEALTHDTARSNWLCSSRLLWDYVFPLFGGIDWYTWFQRKYCQSPRKSVSLGCGEAAAERQFLSMGAFETCVGYDLAETALQIGRVKAAREGIAGLRLLIGDINSIALGDDQYDLVIGWMAWHHVADLEQIYDEACRALKPGGLLLLNEYVGPARFACTPTQSALMEEWLARLPVELKLDLAGRVRANCTPTPAIVAAIDPSEAIRSDEIVPLLEDRFTVLDRIDYGGALLHHLLSGSMQCFDFGNAEHCRWLHRLYAAEREAMAAGIIGSDFTFIVAEPKR